MATATYGVLTAEQRTFWEMAMLPRAVPPFSYLRFGQEGIHPQTNLPENSGDVINWRLMASFSAVTTALTEGITPNAEDISITSTEGTVAEYGSYVKYTRKLASMGIDKVAEEASDNLGEQAGDSFDQITRDVVVAGSTVQYASSASSRGTVTSSMKLTAAEVLEAVATLKTNKAQPINNGLYVGMVHPYTEYDIFQDAIFQAIFFYTRERDGAKNGVNPYTTGYIGVALGVEWYCTPNNKVFTDAGSGTTDVHATMILGKSAFGIGGLGGTMPSAVKSMQYGNNTGVKVRPLRLIQKNFDSGGTSDPLEQRASIGWYSTFVAKRLREQFMVRIEHAATIQT